MKTTPILSTAVFRSIDHSRRAVCQALKYLLMLTGVLLLSACGGSGGGGDDPAPSDNTGGIGSRGTAPVSLFASITDVQFAQGKPTIRFSVQDEAGFPFTLLTASNVSFAISKLIPPANGNSDHWTTYIRSADGGVANAQGGTYNKGSLQNLGEGQYSFQFTDALQDISGVSFEAALTHRIGMEIRNAAFAGQSIPGTDAVFSIQPSTGATSNIPLRKLVDQAACASCHGSKTFAFHGGARKSVDYCVTCHQPDSLDTQTGNTLDFRVMIHKIHRGENLPSVVAGGDFAICGFACDSQGAPATSFAEVVFPQDVRNCIKCHDPANSATPDAINTTQHPSIEACGSCHDDVDFAAGAAGGHPGGVVTDNSECTLCHTENRIAGSVESSHQIPSQLAAGRFALHILSITQTAPGETPKVVLSATDPTNNDAPYNLLSDPEFNTANGASLSMDIAWPTVDYTNLNADTGLVTGRAPARPFNLNLLAGGNLTDNGDGTFTATSTLAVPLAQQGSGAIGIEGHPAVDLDNTGVYTQAPATSPVSFFAITDSSPQARRQVVDIAKCQNCHGQNDGLAFHGNNRNDNIQLCVLCHNANNTDLAQRPADPDATENDANTAAADGLEERSIDFKQMIHSIHGAAKRETGFLVYGFGNSPLDFSKVAFPRGADECDACHVNNSQLPPLAAGVLATTVDSQATVNVASAFGTTNFIQAGNAAADPTDDGNITATAAACAGCHDNTLALAHMRDLGAAGISDENPSDVTSGTGVVVTQANVDAGQFIEGCAVCHGDGRIADVNQAHGLTP